MKISILNTVNDVMNKKNYPAPSKVLHLNIRFGKTCTTFFTHEGPKQHGRENRSFNIL